MKFHHLARQHLAQQQQQHQQAATTRGELSPTGKMRPAATSVHHQQQRDTMSDDEDCDEFLGQSEAPVMTSASFYDSMVDQQRQLQQQQQQLQVAGSNNNSNQNNNQLDSSGFLIDKNKKLFPQKLWELIHNPSIQHCLRWSQDGQRVYLNRNEFEAYYLKTPNNQFHTQKAISFVRQMNMYGFRKVDDCYYENDNFRRDRQHLLRNMIRRHPNKGLFVGLDHHQLAAAAAAQQALQVNQQLQQLEQQQKHRTEQALRLNNYLNSHQFHQSALLAAAAANQQHPSHHLHQHQHQHELHSSPFEHMSSQLAQAAADHITQQQQQHLHRHQQQHHHQNNNTNTISTNNNLSNQQQQQQQQPQQQQQLPVQHQPKKSRLLNNFYATSNNNNNGSGNNVNNGQGNNARDLANQDSMHSTSSVDTQCSSALNSGSAGSPQPNASPSVLQQRIAALAAAAANNNNVNGNTGNGNSNRTSTNNNNNIRAAVLAESIQRQLSNNNNNNNKFGAQNVATDLSNQQQQQQQQQLQQQSLATRQALHQTLVRSLLQLKQHPAQNLVLANLQQQTPRTLLESLASLSSAGTGSVVDPASNSPTEPTSTPPSSPPSPVAADDGFSHLAAQYLENNNLVLDLANKTSSTPMKRQLDVDDYEVDITDDGQRPRQLNHATNEGDETEIEEDDEVEEELSHENELEESGRALNPSGSPLDVAKKVRRFLENQMQQQQQQSLQVQQQAKQQQKGLVAGGVTIKREPELFDAIDDVELRVVKKRKLSGGAGDDEPGSVSPITKSLILEVCDRRGDQLEVTALNEAARYTECFLEILLEDAALIARHSMAPADEQEAADEKVKELGGEEEEDQVKLNNNDKGKVVDTSSLLLALKLIPSKLIAAIQQQVCIQ